MKSFSFILLLFTCILINDDLKGQESLMIQSGEVEYDGTHIFLTGNVIVQHELGQLCSRHLILTPVEGKEKKLQLSFLKLTGDVVIDSKDNGRLCCQEAEIDYENLKGVFLSDLGNPEVIYTKQLKSTEESKASMLLIKSNKMSANLERMYISHTDSYKTSIQAIEANEAVKIYYGHEYVLLADRAIYQNDLKESREVILLFSDCPNHTCWMADQAGNEIQASHIKIDLKNREIILDDPHGTLGSKDNPEQMMHLSCKKLTWKEPQRLMILEKQIRLQQGELTDLQTDSIVEVRQCLLNNQYELESIRSHQNTVLSYYDKDNKIVHKMICPGPLFIDHQNLKLWMYKDEGSEDKGIKPKQVYIEDIAGDLYADGLTLSYQKNGSQLIPNHLILDGHVKILSRFDGHLQESGAILQYALADQVDYFPMQREMILKGKNQQRVLLFDRLNHLQMSAPSLKIRQDTHSQKMNIQGIGDVRFTFIKNELEELKANFEFNETSQIR